MNKLSIISFSILVAFAKAKGADIAISALPAATTVNAADVVAGVQSATTKKFSFTIQKGFWDTFYQPLDGDLTALASLTGTHTIYYRSAANTWSAVTIGTDLDFTGATLKVNSTTVGHNLLNLANPSAIRFIRINADNTVDALDASSFRTAIGAGTGGGDVSSNTSTSVDSEIALFNSTSGKQIKRATGNGIATLSSGVLGSTSISQGDLFYGSASNTLSALTKSSSSTRYVSNTGTSNNPAWAQVDLSNGVTGNLGIANGGLGSSLSDPGSNKLLGWDDTDNTNGYWTLGTGLSYDHSSHTLSASGGSGPTVSKVTGSDFTTTSNSMVDITGLSFSAAAATEYYYEVNLLANSADGNGVAVVMNFNAGGGTPPTTSNTISWGSTTNGSTATDYTSTFNLNTVYLQAGAGNKGIIHMRGFFTTVSSGTLTVRIRKQITSNTATVYIGSFLSVTQL